VDRALARLSIARACSSARALVSLYVKSCSFECSCGVSAWRTPLRKLIPRGRRSGPKQVRQSAPDELKSSLDSRQKLSDRPSGMAQSGRFGFCPKSSKRATQDQHVTNPEGKRWQQRRQNANTSKPKSKHMRARIETRRRRRSYEEGRGSSGGRQAPPRGKRSPAHPATIPEPSSNNDPTIFQPSWQLWRIITRSEDNTSLTPVDLPSNCDRRSGRALSRPRQRPLPWCPCTAGFDFSHVLGSQEWSQVRLSMIGGWLVDGPAPGCFELDLWLICRWWFWEVCFGWDKQAPGRIRNARFRLRVVIYAGQFGNISGHVWGSLHSQSRGPRGPGRAGRAARAGPRGPGRAAAARGLCARGVRGEPPPLINSMKSFCLYIYIYIYNQPHFVPTLKAIFRAKFLEGLNSLDPKRW